MKGGKLKIIELKEGKKDCDEMKNVDIKGIEEIEKEDKEKELVDLNGKKEIEVKLKEKNKIEIVDEERGKIIQNL